MFCPNCGKPLPDGDQFCRYCGAATQSEGTVPPKPAPKRPFPVWLIVLLAAAAVAAGVYFWQSADKPDADREERAASVSKPRKDRDIRDDEDDEADKDEAPAADRGIVIPTVSDFLGGASASLTDDGGRFQVYDLPDDLVTATAVYAELLCSDYGFSQSEFDDSSGSDVYRLTRDGLEVSLAAHDNGPDCKDPDARYFLILQYDEGITEEAAEVYDWSAPAKPSSSGGGEKELVFEPLDSDPMTYTVDRSSVYIQDPQAYFGGDLPLNDVGGSDGYTIWDFRGEAGPMDDYMRLLCSGDYNLTLVDDYHESYNSSRISTGGDFLAYLLDYTGTGDIRQTTGVPYIDGKTANVAVYGSSERAGGRMKFKLYIPEDMETVDLGLRHSGSNVETAAGGASASAGLYRLPDGSFETTDGRLRAAPGQATVLRDGETCEAPASLRRKENSEELWVRDFHRDELLYFSWPKGSLRAGDSFTMEQIQSGAWWVDHNNMARLDSAEDFGGFNWPLCFGAGHDGDYILPVRTQNEFRQILVRVLYAEDDALVLYLYAAFDSAPAEFEALCALDPSRAEDATAKPVSSSGEGTCGACNGDGRCSTCGGSGTVRRLQAGTTEWVEQTCTACYTAGSGKCSFCGGKGTK